MIRNDAGATYAWSVIGHTANVTDNEDGTIGMTVSCRKPGTLFLRNNRH